MTASSATTSATFPRIDLVRAGRHDRANIDFDIGRVCGRSKKGEM